MSQTLSHLQTLEGKTAVITGGAGYLGRAISETLAELGANIVIASRDAERCKKCCQQIIEQVNRPVSGVGLELDLVNKKSIASFFDRVHEHFDTVDILVNNAWSGNKNTWESIGDADWEYDIDMSLNSVFRLTKAAFEDLKRARGVILNISSMYGQVGPDYRIYDGKQFANPPSYGAAKAGVMQLTRYLASFLSPYGIRANSLSPGAFPHPATQQHLEFMERLAAKNPLNRIGQPDELKGAVALLCTQAGSYITGQNICVDGGWTIW